MKVAAVRQREAEAVARPQEAAAVLGPMEEAEADRQKVAAVVVDLA